MPGKVSVLTLGCSKNRVDSEHLMRQLLAVGWQVIPDAPEEEYPLDVLVINTCGFIHDAKMESIECILEALEAKKKQLEQQRQGIDIEKQNNRKKDISL